MNAPAALVLFLASAAIGIAPAAEKKPAEPRSDPQVAVRAKFDAIERDIEDKYRQAAKRPLSGKTELEEQIKTVQGQIRQLQETMAKLEATLRELERTGQTVRDAVGQENRRDTNTRLEAARASLRRLQEQVAALQAKRATTEREIAALDKKRATELAAARTERQRAIEEAKKRRP